MNQNTGLDPTTQSELLNPTPSTIVTAPGVLVGQSACSFIAEQDVATISGVEQREVLPSEHLDEVCLRASRPGLVLSRDDDHALDQVVRPLSVLLQTTADRFGLAHIQLLCLA